MRRLRREKRDNAARQKLIEQLVEALPDPILMIDERAPRGAGQPGGAARISDRGAADTARPGAARSGRARGGGCRARRGTAARAPFSPATIPRSSSLVGPGGRSAATAPRRPPGIREETEQQRLERMRAEFVANASHELRTPLAAILGFIETLQGPAKDDAEARERFLGDDARAGGRMTRLVDDLLSLSRIELDEHTAADRAATDLADRR